jgi:hypothetical protein
MLSFATGFISLFATGFKSPFFVSDSQFVIRNDEKMARIKIKFFGFIILLLKFNDNMRISKLLLKTQNNNNYCMHPIQYLIHIQMTQFKHMQIEYRGIK